MTNSSLQLVIMRHGATAGNEAGRYTGRQNNERLSSTGRAQAQAAGISHYSKTVYTSPLVRTEETARICFPRAYIQQVAGLEEYDFGIFEGKTAHEMTGLASYRSWVDSGCTSQCPGGESRAQYCARSNAALLALLQNAHAAGQSTLVVVAHGGTIMAAFSEYAQSAEAQDYFAWQVRPACGYSAQVVFENAQPVFTNCMPFSSLPL